MNINRPYVLSIAGFDPSSGAGVLADIKTMEQCGVYGLGVSTATTFQNESEFDGVSWLSFEEVQKQLKPLLRKYDIKVVKIGLIQNLEILEQLISLLTTHYSQLKIVWDPILSASAGFEFHSAIDKNRLSQVLGFIYLITPNQQEFEKLGFSMDTELPIKTNVLLKGGHAEVHDDILLKIDGKKKNIERHLIIGVTKKLYSKHGSGCVLSSAIASYLASGNDLVQSCELGKRYVEHLLGSNEGLLGYHSELKQQLKR